MLCDSLVAVELAVREPAIVVPASADADDTRALGGEDGILDLVYAEGILISLLLIEVEERPLVRPLVALISYDDGDNPSANNNVVRLFADALLNEIAIRTRFELDMNLGCVFERVPARRLYRPGEERIHVVPNLVDQYDGFLKLPDRHKHSLYPPGD